MIKKIFLMLSFYYFIPASYSATAVYNSESSNSIYRAIGKKTIQEAIQKVKNACEAEANDCELVIASSQPGYGAIAASKNKGAIFNSALSSKKQAINNVLSRCNQKYGACTIFATWYDPITPPPPPQQTQECYGPFGPTECGALYDYSGRSNYTGKMINGSP
jgi:Domain of unknown function (DUF4189)